VRQGADGALGLSRSRRIVPIRIVPIEEKTMERSPPTTRLAVWLGGAALVALVLVPVDRLVSAARGGILAYDFRQTFLPAAEALLDGRSPYPEYGYPPLVAFASVPFALVPSSTAVLTALLIALVPLSLWLLGVRDWRCHLVALMWIPVFNAVQTANVTLPILVGAAACWRYRERPRPAAVAGGLAIAAKIVAWPLVVWLAANGRTRAALGAVATALVVTFGLWATLGFSGLRTYPNSLGNLQERHGERGYTVQAVAADLGLPGPVGALSVAAVAVAFLGAVVAYGRRRDDERAFACAIVAAIVASPVVWLHSFVLLLAPVAVLRPRLSAVWFVPAALWFVSDGTGNGTPWRTALTLLALLVAVLLVLLRPRPVRLGRRVRAGAPVGDPA
jgi:alpha-1,2-mannosyltransferase